MNVDSKTRAALAELFAFAAEAFRSGEYETTEYTIGSETRPHFDTSGFSHHEELGGVATVVIESAVASIRLDVRCRRPDAFRKLLDRMHAPPKRREKRGGSR